MPWNGQQLPEDFGQQVKAGFWDALHSAGLPMSGAANAVADAPHELMQQLLAGASAEQSAQNLGTEPSTPVPEMNSLRLSQHLPQAVPQNSGEEELKNYGGVIGGLAAPVPWLSGSKLAAAGLREALQGMEVAGGAKGALMPANQAGQVRIPTDFMSKDVARGRAEAIADGPLELRDLIRPPVVEKLAQHLAKRAAGPNDQLRNLPVLWEDPEYANASHGNIEPFDPGSVGRPELPAEPKNTWGAWADHAVTFAKYPLSATMARPVEEGGSQWVRSLLPSTGLPPDSHIPSQLDPNALIFRYPGSGMAMDYDQNLEPLNSALLEMNKRLSGYSDAQLNKMSFPDMVKASNQAKLDAEAATAGKTVQELPDGWSWKQLTTRQQMKQVKQNMYGSDLNLLDPSGSHTDPDNRKMGLCFADPSLHYVDDMESGRTNFYALQDPLGGSHVVLDVAKGPYSPPKLGQVKSFGNAPATQYRSYVEQLLQGHLRGVDATRSSDAVDTLGAEHPLVRGSSAEHPPQ